MLLISSIMFTVLPTPAPPNRPTLPPLANGQIRSITLMPVGEQIPTGAARRTSGPSGGWSGALRCRDRAGFVDRATQHVHDAAERAVPTGTEMGLPVFFTFMPRRRPSEEPSAMVRTTPSPSCCCTSNVSPFGSLGHRASARHRPWASVARELDVHHGADALNDRSLTHRRFPKQ
jgi:hypothetical protein